MAEQVDEAFARTALVTGAGSGIGHAVAVRLLESGARVVATDVSAETLGALEADQVSRRTKLRTIVADLEPPEGVPTLWVQANASFDSPIDLVAACAGRGLSGTVLTSDDVAWGSLISLNFLATMRVMRLAADHLVALKATTSPRRDLVVIGSVTSRNTSSFSPVYSASKAALASAVEALRREVAQSGVRVSVVAPGFVQSGFQASAGYVADWCEEMITEIGPFLRPDEVADAVHYLVSLAPHVHVNELAIRPVRQVHP